MIRKTFLKYYLPVIALIVGFIFTLQIKSNFTSEGIITIPKLLEMNSEIENIRSENKMIIASTAEMQEKLIDYQNSKKNTGSVYASMSNELLKMRDYGSYEPVTGPGIIITMNDSLQEVEEGQDPRMYVIHDIDVLEVINELKAAGAEAISINDERLTAHSSIRCGGPIINIDGEKHATPYVIKAIGDPKTLEAAAMNADGYISLMEIYGIRVKVTKVERMEIGAYKGELKTKYLKNAEGGEVK